MMRREEFYERLFGNLRNYSEKEKEEIREYYEELICDGMEAGLSEEEVIAGLEEPEKIAEGLKRDYAGGAAENIKSNRGEYESKGVIKQLVFSSRDRGVNVKKSHDDKVHVHFEADEYDEVVCNEKNGVFYFKHNTRRRFSFIFIGSYNKGPAEIYVPDSVEIVDIQTTNGGIHASDMDAATRLNIRTTNGGIKCNDLKAEAVELVSTNAGITCDVVNAKNVMIRTSNAGVNVRETQAEENFTVETSNAGIKVNRIKAPDIKLRSSNGTIAGEIEGRATEYAVRSHTSNGKNSLPEEFNLAQQKKLSVSTSNGSIRVYFTE